MNGIMRIYRRCLIGILAISILGLGVLSYRETKDQIPNSYTQTEGEAVPFHGNPLVTEELKEGIVEASVGSHASGQYTISYKYMGIIPLKDAEVTVRKPVYVIPGGIPIGIYMETDGILVVGTGNVTGIDGLNHEPADRILQRGDYIQTVNGEPVYEKEDLIEKVQDCQGEEMVLGIRRKGEEIQVKLKPVETEEKEYKLGIWVRDNTQGIGTLTFLTEAQDFGALGHGINDVDTGTILELEAGSLYDTEIIDIKKGADGSPGELSGLISYRPELVCGRIQENTPVGIFGKAKSHLLNQMEQEKMQVGYKQEIELGEAWIRSGIGGTVKDYRIEITDINRKEADVNKGIILRVTDPELLEMTGGIVQGMSGSPIIQNGKVIGAVTHVFVQDSTKGFGVFIENMLGHVT